MDWIDEQIYEHIEWSVNGLFGRLIIELRAWLLALRLLWFSIDDRLQAGRYCIDASVVNCSYIDWWANGLADPWWSFERLIVEFIDWLIYFWFINLPLLDWLSERLIIIVSIDIWVWLIDWLTMNRLGISWTICKLFDFLFDRCLNSWLTNSELSVRLIWLRIGWLIDLSIDWLTVWLATLPIEFDW